MEEYGILSITNGRDHVFENEIYKEVKAHNLEYDLPKWSKENGFEYVSFEGDGDDDGYEPKFRNNWY